jgi:pimeloyl-ACP methyl ester carboxylesterase
VPGVEACRAAAEKRADLKLYTTALAVDDVDEVRAALGYERIDVGGGSYGSFAALTYLRRHPERVRVVAIRASCRPTPDCRSSSRATRRSPSTR